MNFALSIMYAGAFVIIACAVIMIVATTCYLRRPVSDHDFSLLKIGGRDYSLAMCYVLGVAGVLVVLGGTVELVHMVLV